jgi:hypothetical protein
MDQKSVYENASQVENNDLKSSLYSQKKNMTHSNASETKYKKWEPQVDVKNYKKDPSKKTGDLYKHVAKKVDAKTLELTPRLKEKEWRVQDEQKAFKIKK